MLLSTSELIVLDAACSVFIAVHIKFDYKQAVLQGRDDHSHENCVPDLLRHLRAIAITRKLTDNQDRWSATICPVQNQSCFIEVIAAYRIDCFFLDSILIEPDRGGPSWTPKDYSNKKSTERHVTPGIWSAQKTDCLNGTDGLDRWTEGAASQPAARAASVGAKCRQTMFVPVRFREFATAFPRWASIFSFLYASVCLQLMQHPWLSVTCPWTFFVSMSFLWSFWLHG